MLAKFFSAKMSARDPIQPAHELPKNASIKLDDIKITQAGVLKTLKQVDPQKAMGSDKISPHMLSICAHEAVGPLTKLFRNCMLQKKMAKDLEES